MKKHCHFAKTLIVLSVLLSMLGCSNKAKIRYSELVTDKNWSEITVQAPLPCVALVNGQADTVTIYIEGDGRPYIRSNRASDDPTPTDTLMLDTAVESPSASSAYLGRPCQYMQNDLCSRIDWTVGRFSERVISTMNSMVSEITKQVRAKKIQLVGFSGGSAVAVLIAARRNDVSQLISVCGNIDHKQWTTFFSLTPLYLSLNAIDALHKIENIPQTYLAGGKDEVIVPSLNLQLQKTIKQNGSTNFIFYDQLHHNSYQWKKIVNSLVKTEEK